MPDPIDDSSPFSPYRSDGKLYGFVCVVTGSTQSLGEAIVRELAGIEPRNWPVGDINLMLS